MSVGVSNHVDWLFGLQKFGSNPGLQTMVALQARLGDPQRTMRTVLVGGTNGKGSTSAVLAACLREAGHTVGHFTSPHMTLVMERFRLNGQIPDTRLLEVALERIRPAAEELQATFFEVLTMAAWVVFENAGCDAAVMEIGMGGRWDATNASDPELSVITNISLDHTDVLGDTEVKIAAEKAGILRPGRPAVTGATGDALGVIRSAAGTELRVLGEHIGLGNERGDWSGIGLDVRLGDWTLALSSPLLGAHQRRNVALAAAAAHLLGVSDPAIRAGVSGATWPGRLERIEARGRTWLLDGAHNPAGIQALRDTLSELKAVPRLLVFGVTADKDVAGIVALAGSLAEEVITSRARLSPRALDPGDLARQLGGNARSGGAPADAILAAVAATAEGDLIVVAGSLYLLGEIRPLLLGEEISEQHERLQ